MKQHITIDQLNELSKKGKKKLELWINKGHFTCTYEKSSEEWYGYTLLSIGQMIEFLQTYKKDKRYENEHPTPIDFYQKEYDGYDGWYIFPDLLCDDLWKTVKEVLEKK